MDTEHYRKLERMYLGAPLNQHIYTTTTASIGEGTAEIGLTVEPKYHHGLGAMHGSVYFKLLDDACFFSVASLVKDVFVLTTTFQIHFLRPVPSGKIKAVGKVRFASRELWKAEATLYNEQGKEVGFGSGDFVRSRAALTPEIGYQ